MKNYDFLINEALSAREMAYSPYSGFSVGAALLTDSGEVFRGANVENSSLGGTICAERSAFCAAVSAGHRKFTAISIVGGYRGKEIDKTCAPCGICRQFMSEFCPADFPVLLFDGKAKVEKTLGELLPEMFELKGE